MDFEGLFYPTVFFMCVAGVILVFTIGILIAVKFLTNGFC